MQRCSFTASSRGLHRLSTANTASPAPDLCSGAVHAFFRGPFKELLILALFAEEAFKVLKISPVDFSNQDILSSRKRYTVQEIGSVVGF